MHEIGSSKSKLEHIRIQRQRLVRDDEADKRRDKREKENHSTSAREFGSSRGIKTPFGWNGPKEQTLSSSTSNCPFLRCYTTRHLRSSVLRCLERQALLLFCSLFSLSILSSSSSRRREKRRRRGSEGEAVAEAAAARQLLPIYRSTEGSSSPYSSPPADSFFSSPSYTLSAEESEMDHHKMTVIFSSWMIISVLAG